MDVQSGESEEEDVMGEGIGESETEELVPEWGLRRDKGSWFIICLCSHRCSDTVDWATEGHPVLKNLCHLSPKEEENQGRTGSRTV